MKNENKYFDYILIAGFFFLFLYAVGYFLAYYSGIMPKGITY